MDRYYIENNKATFLSANWSFFLTGLTLFIGLILSILSLLETCVEHCSATQDYRLLGLPFAYSGIGFFVTSLLIHVLSLKHVVLKQVLWVFIALGIGSEIRFLAVQKNQIGHWCPICVSIAIAISLTGLIIIADYLRLLLTKTNLTHRGLIMDIMKKGLGSLSLVFLGFLFAVFGVTKFDQAEAAMNEMQNQLAFGNKNSSIDVYFVTDWFCPSCKKVEPIIEKVLPLIQSKVNFYFVDYAIHRKSMNFTPFNLAFMLHDKQNYLRARKNLAKLAEINENPNDGDIEELARKNQLNFQELSFTQVKAAMEFFDKIVEKYDLRATPIVIITDMKTHKVVKLEGRDEIKENKILDTINSMLSK